MSSRTPILRAQNVLAAGSWQGDAADCVILDYDERHRRRIAMTGVRGLSFLLDLPGAVMLRSGDALVLEDGRPVEVLAAPEPLLEIRAKNAGHLVRVAWHLGNRHLPTQIAGDRLRIRRDHVIEAMVRGLGAGVRLIEAPFDPEGGAYAEHGETQGHSHGHGHSHDGGHRHNHRSDRHDHSPCDHDHHDHGCCGHHHKHD